MHCQPLDTSISHSAQFNCDLVLSGLEELLTRCDIIKADLVFNHQKNIEGVRNLEKCDVVKVFHVLHKKTVY